MTPKTENVTGRIYDIQGFAVHDGPGVRTTVFLKGCPLRCLWCHSPESQRSEYDLSYLAVKCVGKELCGAPCVGVCQSGALIECEPEKAVTGDRMVTKVKVDRERCAECLRCAGVCPSKALSASGREISVEEAYTRINKDRFVFKKDGGATISGGEPMGQFEFTLNLARKLKENGIGVCLDTTGYAPPEQFLEILEYIDLFLYDIKHMDSKKHRSFTGVPNELILSNARLLAENGASLQIRVPVIPKLNAGMENLEQTADFCARLGGAVKLVQLLPYHSMGRSKYARLGQPYRLSNVEPPDEAFMERALEVFLSRGLPGKIR
ncbi:MAG: glycyl-radical enzyme activating protein [Clostridiales bacterium]|jgi:pyruvate formate lyase activating enzyme|nr:glycyl-radical enzyme activating protein [Clostridiales bacterium]